MRIKNHFYIGKSTYEDDPELGFMIFPRRHRRGGPGVQAGEGSLFGEGQMINMSMNPESRSISPIIILLLD